MVKFFILLYVYSLIFVVSNATYCKYPDLQAFPAPHRHTPIDVDALHASCRQYPTFNASIVDSLLVVQDCAHAEFQFGGTTTWTPYSSPVPLKKGQNVFVKCGDSIPVMLIKPPTIEDLLPKAVPSPNPSVFVVMVDAVAYEVLHRMMPNTVDMLKKETEMEVYEFTKFATVGLNSNPNKFAFFGRHDYEDLKLREFKDVSLSWMWEHAKELGYTTVIAEDECPRTDSVWDRMNVHPYADPNSPTRPDFVMLSQMCVPDPVPNKYCVKNRWGYEYVSDYVTEMIHNFEKAKTDAPIFMWSNFIDAHEPGQWAASLMDSTVVNYVRTLAQSSFMDNGVIVLVSDHGLHFGDYAYSSIVGSAENKHPFMYVMAKEGVLDRDVVSKNTDKLVTMNDMYRTLSTLIGHVQKYDPRDVDIFSAVVPEGRTCDMAGIPDAYCMCSYGPQCGAQQTLPDHIWDVCVSQFAHPAHFDWKFYTETNLRPMFQRDFSECEATMHWCAYGVAMGLNGTRDDSLRAYTARTPELASTAYCWGWPTDCNWGVIAKHYFNGGFAVDSVPQK